ncbi:MAG: SGNH/GDSL hydrolase family protein [Acidimicrobiia bacterium]|nr:SGNH/GDSL hydrolase family protein [Acidimicrobiia bacterium]
MKPAVAFFGPILGLVIGAIAFFTIGEIPAIVLAVAVIVVSFLIATYAPVPLLALGLAVQLVALAWGGFFIVDTSLTIVRALTSTEGPAAPPNPRDLAAAEASLDVAARESGFRLELHEDEITAVLQESLQDADVPLRSIAVDITEAEGSSGIVVFTGEFKNGEIALEGSARITARAGTIDVEVIDVELGALDLPGIASGAVDDAIEGLLDRVSDLEALIAEERAQIQSIEFQRDRIVVTGTQAGGDLLTSTSLLAALGEEAATAGTGVEPPPIRLGPGTADGRFVPGDVFYVALGDSLAANVGVDDAVDGYVSRLHNQLELRDGMEYGLRNFGVPGETTGTLLNGGQLTEAIDFIRANSVAYVTIDIGANDLLGHLGSADCSEALEAPGCQERIASAFVAYESSLDEVLRRLREAAPDATIAFLQTYNPFSLGFGASVGLERTSTEVLADFNALAARIAVENDVLVADGFTPMLDTAAATTHMLDAEPDIHPNEFGYDVLAFALLEAIDP